MCVSVCVDWVDSVNTATRATLWFKKKRFFAIESGTFKSLVGHLKPEKLMFVCFLLVWVCAQTRRMPGTDEEVVSLLANSMLIWQIRMNGGPEIQAAINKSCSNNYCDPQSSSGGNGLIDAETSNRLHTLHLRAPPSSLMFLRLFKSLFSPELLKLSAAVLTLHVWIQYISFSLSISVLLCRQTSCCIKMHGLFH